MTISVQCPCLADEPAPMQRGPNAAVRLTADPRCKACAGEGDLLVSVVRDPPPIPARDCDWSAVVDGQEEYGPYGYGATQDGAVENLLSQLDLEI
jgi:hypothetical protein